MEPNSCSFDTGSIALTSCPQTAGLWVCDKELGVEKCDNENWATYRFKYHISDDAVPKIDRMGTSRMRLSIGIRYPVISMFTPIFDLLCKIAGVFSHSPEVIACGGTLCCKDTLQTLQIQLSW